MFAVPAGFVFEPAGTAMTARRGLLSGCFSFLALAFFQPLLQAGGDDGLVVKFRDNF